MMESAIRTNHNNTADGHALDFVWFELTNQCNLRCVHCYSESSPTSTEGDLLNEDQYLNLIMEAGELGCRQLQFIGGEPTLNKSLPRLIAHAHQLGYEFIEVFSNLNSLSDSLLGVFVKYRVAIATSVYASVPELHDGITQTAGSHGRTTSNIQRVLQSGLPIRVSVIAMDQNEAAIDATIEYLRALGISNVGLDHVRGFGRAGKGTACSMGDLCGNCATNILAIGPDGRVAPCIMSKQWSVGSVLNAHLTEIAGSERLFLTRRRIADATADKSRKRECEPDCSPNTNCQPCAPNGGHKCIPNGNCQPGLD
jgi:MoaA/NifB/PqqE/SkfB family radical SAM enzyme